MTRPRRCAWSGCNTQSVATYCAHHAAIKAAQVRQCRELAKLERCKLELTVASRPPWAEELVSVSYRYCHNAARMVRCAEERTNPDRPSRWIEIVNVAERRVVMRSQRTADQLRGVLLPGERLTLCIRENATTGPDKARRYWL